MADIQLILSKYGPIIEQWRGILPAAVVAARIWVETRGEPCPKPTACCDEQGLMQLWPATRAKYNVTDACDPNQNIRAGCLHWIQQTTAMQQMLANTQWVEISTTDLGFWQLAWLYTAIGAGATEKLVKASQARTFEDLRNWVDARAADGTLAALKPWFGTQSPDAVQRRVQVAGREVSAAFAVPAGSGLLIVGLGLGLAWLLRR